MKLDDLVESLKPLSVTGNLNGEVRGISCDSRTVRPGYVFVALKGARQDGSAFIEDALGKGAIAVVSELALARRDVACISVEDARRALAAGAVAYFGNPSSDLDLIGVTGTNGKTTVAMLAQTILKGIGRKPGLIGTVRYELGDRSIPANRTTPQAPELQSLLRDMVLAECDSAVMEVSSHGLQQKRVWGTDFDVGVFTNLTQDHLDYHGSMEAYFESKSLLFRWMGQLEKSATAVINADDPWGRRLLETKGLTADRLTYGTRAGVDVRARNIELAESGSCFTLDTPWGCMDIRIRLLGDFNVSNTMAAIAACGVLGVEPDRISHILESVVSVPGRLEPVDNDKGLKVYVDYAHTDDALRHVLSVLRKVTAKRLIVVFGCGGERDQGKRALMGMVAGVGADHSIITSDNPRGEPPLSIMEAIGTGFGNRKNYEMEPDRKAAIRKAIQMAEAGDTVLVAGKGHENYQAFANTVLPFDDREICREIIESN